jgi:ribonuclease R
MLKKIKNKKNIALGEEEVLSLISKDSYSLKKLSRKLKLKTEKEDSILSEILEKLEAKGKILKTRDKQYKILKKAVYVTGRVDYVSARFAFIISEEMEQDVWVNAKDLSYALDGDIVKVLLFEEKEKKKRQEGKVVEIIERNKKTYVGKAEVSPKGFAFVVPDNKKMFYDIFIKNEDLHEAKDGDKVMVEITEWPSREKNPSGKIVKVLGKAGEHETEMHSIMAEFNLPFEFPHEVETEANHISTEIPAEEIKKRRDFRSIPTFTIDPIDAKDFDDALSIQQLDENRWEIGVHIADVTHYVKLGTNLEDEAYERATSVYLVDRVIPMLPEKLSNELCSLRPNEDKLTFSAVFELNLPFDK